MAFILGIILILLGFWVSEVLGGKYHPTESGVWDGIGILITLIGFLMAAFVLADFLLTALPNVL